MSAPAVLLVALLAFAQDPAPAPAPVVTPVTDAPQEKPSEKPAETKPAPPAQDAPKPEVEPPVAEPPVTEPAGADGGAQPAQDPAQKPAEEPAQKPAEPPLEAPPQQPPAGSNAVAPAPADAAPATADAPDPGAAIDYARRWTEAEYETELARLAAEHPARVRVSTLGTSRLGRRIALVTVGDLATDPDRKPAVLLATDLGARADGRPPGPEAALYAVRALLARAGADAGLAELLGGVTLYAVPAPDPDGLFAGERGPARACRLDRNFPAGWQPSDAIDCPQGPYPCSEPETRELARFLAQRSNVAALALLGAAEPAAVRPGAATAVDAACARVAHAAGFDPARLAATQEAALALQGSLAAFARAKGGAFVLALDPWTGDVTESPFGPAPAGFRPLAAALSAALRELPRLAAAVVHAERLRERWWLVEVDLEVAGALPTACAEEMRRSPASVWLDVDGARVARVGLRRDGAPVGNLEVPRGRTWRVGHLQGSERVRLFLAVEGEPGAQLALAFRSLRGGHAELAVPLAQ